MSTFTKNPPTVLDLSKMFGVSPERIKAQFKKNAAHIRGVIERVKANGGASNYSMADLPTLLEAAENYETKANQ